MTQLTVPPPYSLVLLIQVKTPTSIFGEPSSLHLDSFLLLPRERWCRFTGELPNDSLTLHLRSRWMKREGKPQPGMNAKSPGSAGMTNPWSCSSSTCDMSGVQLRRRVQGAHHQSAKLLFASCRPQGETGTWPRLILGGAGQAWSSTLYSTPLWAGLVGFSSRSPCGKGSDQRSQKAH